MPINKGNNDGLDVFTAMSICTGYDGIGLGLKQVIPNLRTICYVEREAYPIANLVSKIKQGKMDDAPIWDDLATFDGRPFKGMVDVFHGGIPCQPWSCAGKQKGIEDERWIWDDVKRIISEIEPECIFLEEVPGFVRGGGLGYVLSDLAKMGFNAEWGCFSAAEVGAPHKRERLFILAYSEQQRLRGRGDGISAGLCGQVQTARPSELGDTKHDGLFTSQKRASIEERNGSEQAGTFSTSEFERPDIERKELGDTEDLRLQDERKTGRNQVEFDRTDEELAYSESTECQHAGGSRRWRNGFTDNGELADANSQRHYDRKPDIFAAERKFHAQCNVTTGRSKDLADACNAGSQGGERCGTLFPAKTARKPIAKCRYPARPGRPQYDWEEPRTVKSPMGGTNDGYSSWVDEIRMCGNGVVPDCAAKAWVTLWERLSETKPTQGSLFQ